MGVVFDVTTSDETRKAGELIIWGTSSERLGLIADWLREEVRGADFTDRETMNALTNIVRPLADAMNIDLSERDPGPTDTLPTMELLLAMVKP